MNVSRKTLVSMMIVLSMGILLSLPQGFHIEVCFGFDGHVDATPDTCAAYLENQNRQLAGDADEHHHHEDCLDVVIGCTSWDILLRNTEKGDVLGTNTMCSDVFPPAGHRTNAVRPAHFSYSSRHDNGTPAESMISRQTVVLLI